jgi:ornithine cyclodeaminase/alanine dehydrogenase-like protein (mu-crystallin family)
MLILSRSDTLRLAALPPCIDAVAEAFRAYGQGRSLGMARMHLGALDGGAFHLTAGGLDQGGGQGAVGLKLNGRFPPLAGGGGQRVSGAILLSDAATGRPLALLDSAVVTSLRTAAVAAVVAGELAREDADSALLIGAGRQGRGQVDALVAGGRIHRLSVADLDRPSAERLAGYAAEQGLDAVAVDDPHVAARTSDVVVTVTPARAPILRAEDIGAGTLVIALGADAPGKQELEPGLLARSSIVVDVLEQAADSGELQHALAAGLVGRGQIHAELGEIMAGTRPGRTSPEETFVFDGTGTALQDLAAATLLVTEARSRGIGLEIPLED